MHWERRCATSPPKRVQGASGRCGCVEAAGQAARPGQRWPRRARGYRAADGDRATECAANTRRGTHRGSVTRESNAAPDNRRRVDRRLRNRGSVMAGARAERARIDALLRAKDRELSQAMSRASTRARMQAVQVARATRANGGGARLKAAWIKPPRRTSCRPSGASSEAGSDGPSGAVREWLRARPAEAARWGTAEGYPSTSRWAGLGRSDRRWRTRVTSSGTGPASRHSAHPRVVRGALPGVAGAR